MKSGCAEKFDELFAQYQEEQQLALQATDQLQGPAPQKRQRKRRKKKKYSRYNFNSHNKQDNSYRRNCGNRHYDRHDSHSYKKSSDRHDTHSYSHSTDRHDNHDRHDVHQHITNVDNSYRDYSVKHVYKGDSDSGGNFLGGMLFGGLATIVGLVLGGSSNDD